MDSINRGMLVHGATSNTDTLESKANTLTNNLTAVSMIAWVKILVQRTGGRRFWGKGQGGAGRSSNFAVSGTLAMTIQRATTNALAASVETFLAPYPYCFATCWSSGNQPRVYYGTPFAPMVECTYSGTPSAGAGAISDDSGSGYCWLNNGGSGGAALDGIFYIGAIVNREITELAEMREWQKNPFVPSNCIAFHRANSGPCMWDESSNGNHAVVSGPIPIPDYLPRVA